MISICSLELDFKITNRPLKCSKSLILKSVIVNHGVKHVWYENVRIYTLSMAALAGVHNKLIPQFICVVLVRVCIQGLFLRSIKCNILVFNDKRKNYI